MNWKRYFFLIGLSLFSTFCAFTQVKKPFGVDAPDKQTRCEVGITKEGALQYRVLFAGEVVINWSDLGIRFSGFTIGEQTSVKKSTQRSVNEKFAWSLGENDTITNAYNELKLTCVSNASPFTLLVRVFNGSVAFRYEIPMQAKATAFRILSEKTCFQFTEPAIIYQYNQESVFTPIQIDSLSKTCDFPATIRNSKFYISIGEAENDWYTKAELKKGKTAHSLAVSYARDSAVKAPVSFQTPWRTISVSETAIGLHKFSDLNLRLTQTSVKEIPAWIKPGKLIRSQLNTQSGKDCIDFASKHNFQYVMFDAGWYGAEFRSTSDPTTVIPQMDMPAIIQYANDKGIGIILYVNYIGLKAKLDSILPLYKKWGVKGLKFGFVDGLSQGGITWLVSAIRKVNEQGFILDIHDNYKPTGLSRKYPALLTQEGIRGDENSPDAFHTTVLPYTRFLAGPADFTFCYPNSKESFSKNLKVSKAQQLALAVVYFSPLQAIFWYGKPLDYTNEEEIEFFSQVPTVWNESHYLAGDIGKNISVARRKGDAWFVGNVAGLEDWKGSIRLDFLKPGIKYIAVIYEDTETGGIQKKEMEVTAHESFSFDIKAKGGQAVIIRRQDQGIIK